MSGGEELLLSTKDSLGESPEILQVCHSEGARSATEESLSNLLESPQRFFGAEAPQNDNKSNPQDKTTLQGKLLCHSERSEESLKESLVAKRDSSLDSQAQNDKLTTFTRNPKSNDSQKAKSNYSPLIRVSSDSKRVSLL
ncbi:hypothetical protein [Helicobacter marmotae]|uniref:Uncharacterized protein n=1 Tax=Helicobacter marmotae TaxID=152490 RepID=A0A3D8I252_9HELI|nr:hypothetical protein [Helicobacter marmotae]RDU59209.1 hypothetical protein CQA63_07570 [Helicobacter marmotae]